MNTAIVLMEIGKATLPKAVYTDWDWATLICAKHNQGKAIEQGFYLVEVPFDATSYPISFEVTREGSEIIIRDWEDNEILGEIKLEQDTYEERFHEEGPVETKRIWKLDSVRICNTPINVVKDKKHKTELKLSDELKKLINNEAEEYLEFMNEMLENS